MGTPRITGYLLAGAACGPFGLGALTASGTKRLAIVDNACLACIGLAAGSEVSLPELRKNARRTVVTIASVAACAWTLTFCAFDAVLASRVEFLRGLSERHVKAVGSLLGTLALARSPASAMAVISEMEASGPFCSHILSTTVVKDVVVVALFAMNVELIALSGLDFHRIVLDTATAVSDERQATPNATGVGKLKGAARRLLVSLKPATQWETSHALTKVFQPLVRVIGAMLAGILAGILLGRLLKPTAFVSRWKHVRIACIVGGATGIFVLSEHFALEPLLVCVVAGLVAANRKNATAEHEREELHAAIAVITPTVNLLFFTLAGASLRLENAYNSISIAVSLVIVRLVALYYATAISSKIMRVPAVSEITGEKHKNIEWMGHVTQAGVALGLARTVAARFPYWGPSFSTLAVSIIVMNLFIGPVLFRAAIELSKESHLTPTREVELAEVAERESASPQTASKSTLE